MYTDDLTYLGSARTSRGAHPYMICLKAMSYRIRWRIISRGALHTSHFSGIISGETKPVQTCLENPPGVLLPLKIGKINMITRGSAMCSASPGNGRIRTGVPIRGTETPVAAAAAQWSSLAATAMTVPMIQQQAQRPSTTATMT